MPPIGPLRIVRYEVASAFASTGDAERYVTDCGGIWRRAEPLDCSKETGKSIGIKIGDMIYLR